MIELYNALKFKTMLLKKLIKNETGRSINKTSTQRVGGSLFCFCPSAIDFMLFFFFKRYIGLI